MKKRGQDVDTNFRKALASVDKLALHDDYDVVLSESQFIKFTRHAPQASTSKTATFHQPTANTPHSLQILFPAYRLQSAVRHQA